MKPHEYHMMVLTACLETVRQYLHTATVEGFDPGHSVHVRVATASSLGDTRITIDEDIRYLVFGALPDVTVAVTFTLDKTLEVPQFLITITPPIPGTATTDLTKDSADETQSISTTLPSPSPTPDRPITIELSIQTGHKPWQYIVYPSTQWVPLGRGVEPTVDHPAIRVPNAARGVPRGELLFLRYHEGHLVVHRSSARVDEYAVVVDGQRLQGKSTIPITDQGSITYINKKGEKSTLIFKIIYGDDEIHEDVWS